MSKTEAVGKLGLVAVALAVVLVPTCRKWDNPLDPTGNYPPWEPSNPHPCNSGFGPSVGLVLSWESHDPDSGDVAYFAVAFGTDPLPSVFKENGFDTTFRPTGVACSTLYYWRVRAYDDFDTVLGPVWRFQTVPALVMTAPDTGEQLKTYSTDTIAWTGGPPEAKAASGTPRIAFTADGRSGRRPDAAAVLAAADSVVVSRSADDGASWIRLGRATTPGQYVWQVPAPATESARVRVQVHASYDTMVGISGRFVIADSVAPQTAGVTSRDCASARASGEVRRQASWPEPHAEPGLCRQPR
ncbi:hypothetical protein JXD38_01320 [candidate division WOR-3 bacterium]|nr:hypothetical protein [candidate division WOR-3 bacterium]